MLCILLYTHITVQCRNCKTLYSSLGGLRDFPGEFGDVNFALHANFRGQSLGNI